MESWYDSWLILGYGGAFVYLLVNPAKAANANALRRAFQFYVLSISCILTAALAGALFKREMAHDVQEWIRIAFWGLFLFSLLQFWKALRGSDLF
jgi:hypothetical protein